ncbi:MAG: haloacid dehalogenase [Anaerolineaceae bacterium]|nr:haloacid dehalogenase [Anaerolineaceae bacterium]
MKFKSIIFDMDGVLWKDQTPLTNLKNIFKKLDAASIEYAFATNNSTKTPVEYQKKIALFGVQISPEQVITSGTNLASLLKENYPTGGPLYIIGENGLVDILKDYGFYYEESSVLAVAGGLDRSVTYEQLKKATILINNGSPFYFTNPDPSYPSPEGNIPGAGAIKIAIEAATGVKAITPGKPEAFMFLNALKYLKSTPQETLVIGDRLDTDILGGVRTGCKTALVLTGVTTSIDLEVSEIQPDYVFQNIDELITTLEDSDWEIIT